MIVQMRKKVAKDHTFVLSEKVRIDRNLPIDLWQQEVMLTHIKVIKILLFNS